MKKLVLVVTTLFAFLASSAQDKKIVATAWDGVIVSGFVDDGAFVNFGGPSIKYVQKPMSIGFGVLPSMRIKPDVTALPGASRNAWVMPSLGYGVTFAYKHFAMQVPAYYNPKTATSDGKWNLGFGVGYKF